MHACVLWSCTCTIMAEVHGITTSTYMAAGRHMSGLYTPQASAADDSGQTHPGLWQWWCSVACGVAYGVCVCLYMCVDNCG